MHVSKYLMWRFFLRLRDARNKDICVIKRVREGLYKDCILRLEPQLLLSSLDCIPISVYIYHLSNKEYTSAHSFRNIHFFSRSDWTWASTIWTAPKIMMSHACFYGIRIPLSVQTSIRCPGAIFLSFCGVFSSRKICEKVAVARFDFIWQLLSNHEVISFKRFVSSFTTKLCN